MAAAMTKTIATHIDRMKRVFLGAIRMYDARIDILVNPEAKTNNV
jgi:hypothetical protein